MDASSRRILWLLVAIGILLRLGGLRGELWLDEITSAEAVASFTRITEIFSWFHDNNHVLNSLWLFIIGSEHSPIWLRLFSFACGVGTLLLIGKSSLIPSIPQRLILTFLFACSYPLVLYDSEARGYAAMLCGALTAAWTLSYYSRTQRSFALVIFWVGCITSMLGHLSGLFAYVPMLLWTSLESRAFSWRQRVLLHAPVLCVGAFFWFVFGSRLPEGSGTLRPTYETIINLLSNGYGGPLLSESQPTTSLIALGWALAALLLIVKGCIAFWRSNRALGLVIFAGIFIVPFCVLVILEPRVLYERYFLIPLCFSYVAVAAQCAYTWQHAARGKVFVVAVLLLIGIGNAFHSAQLLRYGRGSYTSVLGKILAQDMREEIAVAVDHPFRGGTLVRYYSKRIPDGKRIVLTPHVAEAGWYLVHSQDSYSEIPTQVIGAEFALVYCTHSAAISGWRWCAYQRR